MNTQTKTSEGRSGMPGHVIVSREEWVEARTELLKKEKELTRVRDRLSAEGRHLPWVTRSKSAMCLTVRRARRPSPISSTDAANPDRRENKVSTGCPERAGSIVA
jgi:hypothetical protein